MEEGTWGRLLGRALEKAVSVPACGSLKSTDLGLGAVWDTAGARDVGDTDVKEDDCNLTGDFFHENFSLIDA